MLLRAGHPVWMSFPHSSSKSSIFPVNDLWMACLNRHLDRGWTRLVRPPGITAVAVLFSWSCCFTVSVRWALNESQTSKLWVFANPPGRARQTFSIQILTPLSSIHPFGWLCTTMPAGKLSFGIVFRLKMTIGLRFHLQGTPVRLWNESSYDQLFSEERFWLQRNRQS